MKYYLIKIKDNKSPVGKICSEMSCTPYGVELTEEEIRLIISAVEQYYNIEREYKTQYKHNMEVTFPLLKKLRRLK